VKGSGPPAWVVVVTPPTALVGADETVPPTELEVVSRVVDVTPDVVVVAPLVLVTPEVLVAPEVVVGFTVVVVTPEVVVGFTVVVVTPEVVVGFTVVVVTPEVVVGFTVVVVTPEVVVGFTVVVVTPEVVVGFTVVVVAPLVVVVPPEVAADASCPTLTPASTVMPTATSQAAVRRRTFLTCWAIDPYLLLSATTELVARCLTGQTRQPPYPPPQGGGADRARPGGPAWA
jgi:hypothetical protein